MHQAFVNKHEFKFINRKQKSNNGANSGIYTAIRFYWVN